MACARAREAGRDLLAVADVAGGAREVRRHLPLEVDRSGRLDPALPAHPDGPLRPAVGAVSARGDLAGGEPDDRPPDQGVATLVRAAQPAIARFGREVGPAALAGSAA